MSAYVLQLCLELAGHVDLVDSDSLPFKGEVTQHLHCTCCTFAGARTGCMQWLDACLAAHDSKKVPPHTGALAAIPGGKPSFTREVFQGLLVETSASVHVLRLVSSCCFVCMDQFHEPFAGTDWSQQTRAVFRAGAL